MIVTMDKQYRFKLGDHVKKTKGSQWQGKVVGFYSTDLTPWGCAVESDTEKGSVQIYPETALDFVNKPRIQREEWVNVYPTFTSRGHQTREIAERFAEDGRIACVKRTIDCEEGDGL